MKIKFTTLEYQRAAVAAVTDCFKGQPFEAPFSYNIDPGSRERRGEGHWEGRWIDSLEVEGFRNNPLKITDAELLKNIRDVQANQNLVIDPRLKLDKISAINLDVEMETGTGKTYCYIKTIFELNKLYGWSKFIIMAPSVAIREGIYKSFQMTAEHFQSDYGHLTRYFIYNSSALHNIEAFASDSGINVMIINIQAFNARGAANRRIYEELDDFQSRRPIDVLAATRPIIILDEPQKMEGGKTLDSLTSFNPLILMAKPYNIEMQRLSSTFQWASDFNELDPLCEIVHRSGGRSLSAIGSGGSLTTAYALSDLHQYWAGQVSNVMSTLQAISATSCRSNTYWLLSAGGRNSDILTAFDSIVYQEPKQLVILTSNEKSPLATKALSHSFVDFISYNLPAGKDGFLATNSILAFITLITRAYLEIFAAKTYIWADIQTSLKELFENSSVFERWRKDLEPVLCCPTISVLHGATSKIGAIDLESKFTEAALGNIQIADYRNFAHGRHI